MKKIFVTDPDECGRLWKELIHPQVISDIWEFRLCFHRHFNHQPCFLLYKDRQGIAGLVPLAFNPMQGQFVFFPGETWKGRTWLERTPVYARSPEMIEQIIAGCPKGTFLRYVQLPDSGVTQEYEVDEIGYVLYPSVFDYDIRSYFKRFSNKRLKSIMKTIHRLTGSSRFHLNRLEDYDQLVKMNIRSFGSHSYLYNKRFRNAFRDVVQLLHAEGVLRLISLEIEGKLAAIDLGALYNGTYTVFLGGTCPDMPGVAKVINLYHLEFAFTNNIKKIDFLCNDFHWKKLWHLDPEPLYQFKIPKAHAHMKADKGISHAAVSAIPAPAEALSLTTPFEHYMNRVSNVR